MLTTFNPLDEYNKSQQKYIAGHIDGDKYNNKLSNLQWMQRRDITLQSYKLGKICRGHAVFLNMYENEEIINSLRFNSIKAAQDHIDKNRFFSRKVLLSPRKEHQYFDPDTNHYSKYVPAVDDNEVWKLYMVGKYKRQYFVSNYSRIKTKYLNQTREVLKQTYYNNGYLEAALPVPKHEQNSNVTCTRMVHRMVAQLFVPNPNNYKYIDQTDADSTNNNATNLRWVKNLKENNDNPSTQLKRRAPRNLNPIVQLDEDTFEVLKVWKNAHTIHKETTFHSSNVLTCCRGKRASAYGYRWQFA